MLKLSTDNTVNGFIQNYSHLLTGSPDNASVLTLSFNLEICKVHGSSDGKCETNCKCLHICKFQMMNRCSRGRNCIFGHNLRSNHNNSVLKFHKMEKLSNQQIRELLSSLNNRKGLTLPGICSFYNSNIGCQRSRKCSFLHLCKYFIRGNCRFGEEKCCFSHDVSEDQPRRILRRYGLNGTTIEDLQRLMVAEYPSSSDEDYLYTSDEQCSESASSNEYERQEAKSFSIYDQLYKKWGSSDQSNRFEDTSDSSNEGQEFDALANQEEMRVPFENESYALDRLRTSGEKIHCLTAWTSEPLCESRHQALDFGLHIDEERNDPRERNSPLIGNDVLQMTRSAPSVAHCWQVFTRTDRRTVELSVRDHQELESLYHTYLRAKQPTIRLNGRNMSIDFEAMSGRRKTEKGTEEFIIKRYHSANISD
ncbi:zinc finger CCCH-type antiviral protein 1-like [Ylistrum balloti]|uniref:zinc finger CCCH-type antiviral protein 1-like n=1 Tax=Ylistrum balloti TaxID=509963 RepID=UPI002905992B|nr:zinc finger CCCH-type antiviral protein 1-like [Ylistrum balloti]